MTKVNFEKINSVYDVSEEQLEIYGDDIDKLVKDELAYSIAKLIVSKMDKLPVNYTVEENDDFRGTRHKISFVIVDEDKVKSLIKSGELKYNK